VQQSGPPDGLIGTQSWFDDLRAKLVRIVNRIDPSSRGDPFAKRVANLRDKGSLPANVATWMLTWTSLRNIVAFDGYCLSNGETRIADRIREELEIWIENKAAI
jgi:hypothetical protein